MKNLVQMKFLPANTDLGLLVLRLAAIMPLFLRHGIEKLFTFSAMAAHFPDPIGIGPVPSLIFAMVGDSICTILMVVGLAARWAALISAVNLLVAWIFVHHFVFLLKGPDPSEVIVLYLAVTLTLLIAGPGKYSVDGLMNR